MSSPDPKLARPQNAALFVMASDPRVSRLPAEGIRIAAGVSAWRKTTISLYVGTGMLDAFGGAAEILDHEVIIQYLPDLLPALDRLLLPAEAGAGAPPPPFETANWSRVHRADLARWMARCPFVLRF